MDNEKENTPEDNDDQMEGWSQHYADPGETETPIMLSVVLCHKRMVQIMTVPYDMAEFAVDMHKKVMFPGWIVAVDILTGDVIFRNANTDR